MNRALAFQILIFSVVLSSCSHSRAPKGSTVNEVSKFYTDYYAIPEPQRDEVRERYGLNRLSWPIKGRVAPIGGKIYISLTNQGYGIYALGNKKPIILPPATENATLCIDRKSDEKPAMIIGVNIDPGSLENCQVAAFFLYVDKTIYFWNLERDSRGYFDFSELE